MIEKIFDLQPQKYGLYNDLEILPYLVEKKAVKYIIYGAGEVGQWFEQWVRKVYGIVPQFFVDDEPVYEEISGIKVISKNKFNEMENDKYFVVVAMHSYQEADTKKLVVEFLKEKGAVTIFNANRISYQYKISWYTYIKEHIEEFNKTYDMLCDEISKHTYIEYFKTYILGNRYEGKTFPEEYKYWGIDDEDNRLFELSEQEVLLNLGGACGDTVFQYLKGNFPFEKIITVEAEEVAAGYLKRSIDLLEESTKEKIRLDKCYIGSGENTLDKRYANEKITLINMDIEGAELDVLKTGVSKIKKDRPILAICAYHKVEDLIVIPKFIKENFSDYVLELRKYPSNYWNYIDGIQQINELVLYAIPIERYKSKEA